ncbi:hypothetical protein MMC07_006788 [Pseudocyphellaria aurata]|nr:hypothetical protein [Pseudocyphellaria aurata]
MPRAREFQSDEPGSVAEVLNTSLRGEENFLLVVATPEGWKGENYKAEVENLKAAVNEKTKEVEEHKAAKFRLEGVLTYMEEEVEKLKAAQAAPIPRSPVPSRCSCCTDGESVCSRRSVCDNSNLIRKTFRKLGLSLAIDGSEDDELWVKDIPDIEVGDWRRSDGHEEVKPDNPIEVDEATNEIYIPEGINKAIDQVEYVLEGHDEVGSDDEVQNERERHSDNELEDDVEEE